MRCETRDQTPRPHPSRSRGPLGRPAARRGHREWHQSPNLGSAILHTDGKENILFALNHYVEAVRFVVEFGCLRPQRLVDLDTGGALPVRNDRVLLDLDRKSAGILTLGVPLRCPLPSGRE